MKLLSRSVGEEEKSESKVPKEEVRESRIEGKGVDYVNEG